MAPRTAAKAKTASKRDKPAVTTSNNSIDSQDDSDAAVTKPPAPKRPRKETPSAADGVSAPRARGRTRARQTAPKDTSTGEPDQAAEACEDSKSDDAQETAPKRTRSTRSSSHGTAAAARTGKKAAQAPLTKTGTTGRAGKSSGTGDGPGSVEPAAAAAAAAGSGDGTREGAEQRYWLMKSEPEEFSLDDLASRPQQTSHWEGVRNAQARNLMKSMRLGDEAFFYHSSCKVPSVVGVVRVVREAYPDHFAFDKSSKYHDPRSTPEAPKWWMVDVQLVRRLARPVTLAELRAEGARGPPIADMVLINKSRLSVQPVTPEQWQRILQLESGGEATGDEK